MLPLYIEQTMTIHMSSNHKQDPKASKVREETEALVVPQGLLDHLANLASEGSLVPLGVRVQLVPVVSREIRVWLDLLEESALLVSTTVTYSVLCLDAMNCAVNLSYCINICIVRYSNMVRRKYSQQMPSSFLG